MVTLNEDQQKGMEKLEAFRLRTKNLESSNLFFLLEGFAGSGKTTLVSEFINRYPNGVVCTAPTHKAKNVLISKIANEDIRFDTVHSFLGLREDIQPDGHIEFKPSGRDKTDGCRMLVVDEASMVNSSLLGYLVMASYDKHIPIVFVGDGAQIPPVKEDYSPVFSEYKQKDLSMEVQALQTIVRQAEGNPIIGAASRVRTMPESLHYGGLIEILPTDMVPFGGIFHAKDAKGFLPYYAENSGADHAKILCWTNAKVKKYNNLVRHFLNPTEARIIAPGDRIILTEPLVEDNVSLLNNNTEAVVQKVSSESINLGDDISIPSYECIIAPDDMRETFKIYVPTEEGKPIYDNLCANLANRAKTFPKGSLMAKGAWRDFYAFKRLFIEWQHGYAMTVHRSQGSTFTHCLLDMADMWKNPNTYERNKLIYTAITRASTSVNIIW